MAADQDAVLRHDQALVVLQGGAGAVWLAGVALVLVVALCVLCECVLRGDRRGEQGGVQ